MSLVNSIILISFKIRNFLLAIIWENLILSPTLKLNFPSYLGIFAVTLLQLTILLLSTLTNPFSKNLLEIMKYEEIDYSYL